MTMPSLGETYTLTELPRIPELTISQRVVFADSQKEKSFASTDTIDLGISKLMISSYILKPTPKLLWSYPLSPNTVIDAMDVKGHMYCIGTTERKKSKLLLIKKTKEDPVTAEIDLPASAVALKFSTSRSVHVLLKNGLFVVAKYSDESTLAISLVSNLSNVPIFGNTKTEVVYSTFVSGNLFDFKKDLLFYVATKNGQSAYRLVAMDGEKSFEIYQMTGDANPKDSPIYAYYGGVLYSYDIQSKALSSAALLKPTEILKLLSLVPLFKTSERSKPVSINAVAGERLLISGNSLIFLINFKHGSLLSEHTNKSGNVVYLGFALPVDGESQESRYTFALYLNLDEKTKTCKLKLIQADVGLNLLSESLGKAINRPNTQKWNGVPDLQENDLVKANEERIKSINSIYEMLQKHVAERNVDAFDTCIIDFFKKGMPTKNSDFAYSSADSVVDYKFIELILSLVIAFDADKYVQVKHEDFFPLKAVAYLLTHPLFPGSYTKGLLVLLSALDQPDLLKLAITSSKTMTIDELMTEFVNLTEVRDELGEEENDESAFVHGFLLATIARMTKDYSVGQITSSLLDALNAESESDSKKLEKMLNVLVNINTNDAWTLVQAVIDVGGLFNWSISTISALSEVIDSKLEALTQNSYNLTLTNQAIVGPELKNKKNASKKGASKVIDNIHEITNQRIQLDAILTISNNTTNKKLFVDEGIELAKQIPSYSREKLIL